MPSRQHERDRKGCRDIGGTPLTERFARQRLSDLTRDRDASVPPVLFVCVANAGRSQLAAALVNQIAGDPALASRDGVEAIREDIAGDRIEVRSAGSMPADQINLTAVEAMSELGIDITSEQSRRVRASTPSARSVTTSALASNSSSASWCDARFADLTPHAPTHYGRITGSQIDRDLGSFT